MMYCVKLTLFTLLFTAPDLLVAGETVITCDKDVIRLSCNYRLIIVTSATYGRTDGAICPVAYGPLTTTNTNCNSDVTTIADRCNGLPECEIHTEYLDTPNPCPGTYKYYTITYDCVDGRDIAVCENGYQILDCGTGAIDIINANFGRGDTTTCADGETSDLTWQSFCYAPGVFEEVAALCNGKTSCIVHATSSYNFEGLCPSAFKYLSVSYRCSRTVVTCDGQNCAQNTAELSCGVFQIHIRNALYGRTDSTICSGVSYPAQVANTNCIFAGAQTLVEARCNGYSTCSVPASTSFFSPDPCPGISKYLKIEYICV